MSIPTPRMFMTDAGTPSLADLEWLPYLTESGEMADQFDGKVGVYAIFDQDKALQFVGYSRDIALSLKQHLVRQPQQCHWVKMFTVSRPSKTMLEGIRDAWIAEQGAVPPGNGSQESLWTQAIDAKTQMTEAEKAAYAAADDLGRMKTLKQVARRVEQDVFAALKARGVTLSLRFDPKLKEDGLLSLK